MDELLSEKEQIERLRIVVERMYGSYVIGGIVLGAACAMGNGTTYQQRATRRAEYSASTLYNALGSSSTS